MQYAFKTTTCKDRFDDTQGTRICDVMKMHSFCTAGFMFDNDNPLQHAPWSAYVDP